MCDCVSVYDGDCVDLNGRIKSLSKDKRMEKKGVAHEIDTSDRCVAGYKIVHLVLI